MRTNLLICAACLMLAVSCFGGTIETGTLALATNLNSTTTFTFNTTNDTFSLDFSITNTGTTTADINSFALQLLGGSAAGVNVTSSNIASFPTWEFFDNQKINNNGTTGCTGNSHPGWLCADDNGNVSPQNPTPVNILVGAGNHVDFTFSGTFTGTPEDGSTQNPLELMANGLTNIGDSNSKWAVSAGTSVTTTTTTTTPEPGSLLLFGTGLSGLAAFLRKQKNAK